MLPLHILQHTEPTSVSAELAASILPKTSPKPFAEPAPQSVTSQQQNIVYIFLILRKCDYVSDKRTMPAWKDADGGITFCAETEVGIRWVELEDGKKKNEFFLGVYLKNDWQFSQFTS